MQRVSLLPDRSTFNRETGDPNWPRGRVKKPTILDKINGKPRPPLSPKSRMGKWRVFTLRTASSLIWGLIWGDGGLLFHFILSKIVVTDLVVNKLASTPGLMCVCFNRW